MKFAVGLAVVGAIAAGFFGRGFLDDREPQEMTQAECEVLIEKVESGTLPTPPVNDPHTLCLLRYR